MLGINQPRLLVLATHGYFLQEAPNMVLTLTKLVIAGDESEVEGLNVDLIEQADPLMRSGLALAGANLESKRPEP